MHSEKQLPRLLIAAAATLMIPTAAFAEEVNVENFVRAESDTMFRQNMAAFGADVGEVFLLKFGHISSELQVRSDAPSKPV